MAGSPVHAKVPLLSSASVWVAPESESPVLAAESPPPTDPEQATAAQLTEWYSTAALEPEEKTSAEMCNATTPLIPDLKPMVAPEPETPTTEWYSTPLISEPEQPTKDWGSIPINQDPEKPANEWCTTPLIPEPEQPANEWCTTPLIPEPEQPANEWCSTPLIPEPEQPANEWCSTPLIPEPEQPANEWCTTPLIPEPEQPANEWCSTPLIPEPEQPANEWCTTPLIPEPEQPANEWRSSPLIPEPDLPANEWCSTPLIPEPEQPANEWSSSPLILEPEQPTNEWSSSHLIPEPEQPANEWCTTPLIPEPEQPANELCGALTPEPDEPANEWCGTPLVPEPDQPATEWYNTHHIPEAEEPATDWCRTPVTPDAEEPASGKYGISLIPEPDEPQKWFSSPIILEPEKPIAEWKTNLPETGKSEKVETLILAAAATPEHIWYSPAAQELPPAGFWQEEKNPDHVIIPVMEEPAAPKSGSVSSSDDDCLILPFSPPAYKQLSEDGTVDRASTGAATAETPEVTETTAAKSASEIVCCSRWRISSTILRQLAVTVVLMLISQSLSSVNMVNSGFLALHFTDRNISSVVYGVVASGVGIGYVVAPFIGVFHRLHYDHSIPLHIILLGVMILEAVTLVAYALSDHLVHNTFYSVLSVALRITSGFLSYLWSLTVVESIRAWLPEYFQLLRSIVCGTACYVGYSIASSTGTALYNASGHHMPYLVLALYIAAIVVFTYLTVPRGKSPISDQSAITKVPPSPAGEKDILIQAIPVAEDRISLLVYLPLLAQGLANLAGGYSVAMIVPYLTTCCEVDSTSASTLISVQTFAIAIGFLVAGLLSERKVLTLNTISLIGSVLSLLGILFLFPSPSIPLLYSASQFTAYPAMVLIGLGDSFLTAVTLSAMEDTQTELAGRSLNAAQRSTLASHWLVGWVICNFGGMFLAGLFMDYLSFEAGGWILAAAVCVSVMTGVGMRVLGVYENQRKAAKEHAVLQNVYVSLS